MHCKLYNYVRYVIPGLVVVILKDVDGLYRLYAKIGYIACARVQACVPLVSPARVHGKL